MLNYDQLIKCFRDNGCTKLYAKVLADNDNSKNQVYLGSDFKAINVIPYKSISDDSKIYKAQLDFSWIDDEGGTHPAKYSQIILYPQYPEVRFSGFLLGCKKAPSELMRIRQPDRVLFLGIKEAEGSVLGYVVAPDSSIAKAFAQDVTRTSSGIFYNLSAKLLSRDPRKSLLEELKRIHLLGWVDSKRLNGKGQLVGCKAPNCGGYTLEAELGIIPNGRSEPDYLGWEIKQHGVAHFDRILSGVITLMTPEPTGGVYKTDGVIKFVKKYGYKDKKGRSNRLNFGGVHHAGISHVTTGLTLDLVGYDKKKNKIIDSNGGIALISSKGTIAAIWHFKGLLSHWNRKHAYAAYIPSMVKKMSQVQYCYGNIVRLGENTDFLNLLKAVSSGQVYYDPGIKVEKVNTSNPTTKRRSQFRIKSADIPVLYSAMEEVDLLNF